MQELIGIEWVLVRSLLAGNNRYRLVDKMEIFRCNLVSLVHVWSEIRYLQFSEILYLH